MPAPLNILIIDFYCYCILHNYHSRIFIDKACNGCYTYIIAHMYLQIKNIILLIVCVIILEVLNGEPNC